MLQLDAKYEATPFPAKIEKDVEDSTAARGVVAANFSGALQESRVLDALIYGFTRPYLQIT